MSGFDLFDHSGETGWIVNGHLRQLLAIQLNIGLDQAVDKLAVANVVLGTGRRDADDPQATELTFLGPTVTKGKYTSSNQRFFSSSQKSATTAHKTRGALQNALVGLAPCGTLTCSHGTGSFKLFTSGPAGGVLSVKLAEQQLKWGKLEYGSS